jgi:hypothetical protein
LDSGNRTNLGASNQAILFDGQQAQGQDSLMIDLLQTIIPAFFDYEYWPWKGGADRSAGPRIMALASFSRLAWP